MTEKVRCLLFVYGTLRQGEVQHALLATARHLRMVSTVPSFHLVEVAPYAALVRGGTTSVTGELYELDLATRGVIDVERQVPQLFTRETIDLSDGTRADAYLLTSEQVRGRRRLAHGDWKKRFSRAVSPNAGGAWVAWARGRWSK
jgi:gamma-glutamylcyclotransferase (GGCT)/AIG2-like uncharacterized protein YtfP